MIVLRPGLLRPSWLVPAALGVALLLPAGRTALAQAGADDGISAGEEGQQADEPADKPADKHDTKAAPATAGKAQPGEPAPTAEEAGQGAAVAKELLGGSDNTEESGDAEAEPVESAEQQPDEADDAAVAAAIAETTGIYLTMQKRRDPLERTIADGPRAEIWLLQAIGGTPEEVERARCQAYRWLLFGRLTHSHGVRDVFQKYPKLKEIRLSFFTVDTQIKADGRRGYRQTRKANPGLELVIGRDKALALDLVKLRASMASEGCVAAGEQAVDRKWYASADDKQDRPDKQGKQEGKK